MPMPMPSVVVALKYMFELLTARAHGPSVAMTTARTPNYDATKAGPRVSFWYRFTPGLSATAKITTAHRSNALIIPIQALVQRTPPTVVGPLSPGRAADELLGYLRHHGYLVESDPG